MSPLEPSCKVFFDGKSRCNSTRANSVRLFHFIFVTLSKTKGSERHSYISSFSWAGEGWGSNELFCPGARHGFDATAYCMHVVWIDFVHTVANVVIVITLIIIISATEFMFLRLFVCLLACLFVILHVSRITKSVVRNFARNLSRVGRLTGQNRPDFGRGLYILLYMCLAYL